MKNKSWKLKELRDDGIKEYEVEITHTYKITKTIEDIEQEIKMHEDEIKRIQKQIDDLKEDLDNMRLIK